MIWTCQARFGDVRRVLSKSRDPGNPGVDARSVGLSAVAPTPISPSPQTLQRPELARHHESGKKVLLTDLMAQIELSCHISHLSLTYSDGVVRRHFHLCQERLAIIRIERGLFVDGLIIKVCSN